MKLVERNKIRISRFLPRALKNETVEIRNKHFSKISRFG